MSTSAAPPRLIDIGSNLVDPVFTGLYHGKQQHPADLHLIIQRAKAAGVVQQILTGDSLSGAKSAIALAETVDGLWATVGAHPCKAYEFDRWEGGPEAYLEELAKVIEQDRKGKKKVVAVGECGLDFDRLEWCSKEVQLKYFPVQLELATRFDLPLFLHSRAAHKELVEALRAYPHPLRGVVHSHSGTLEEALEYIEMGFFVGINGCSLKTAENIACVKALPLDKLMLESDCPYCEIRPSHASHPYLSNLSDSPLKDFYAPQAVKKEKWVEGKAVRSRNEPLGTGLVAWVVAQIKGVSLDEVASVTYKNTIELFRLSDTL